MIKFLSKALWLTISSFSKKATRSKVAVAYLGTNASKLLHLKKGDTLVIAMSLNNVKLGQVNPFEVEKFLESGVRIFKREDLHSKVYVFDDKAVVGSANVSSNSAGSLVESAILTDDKSIVSEARKFIDRIVNERVDQAYIDICKKHYKPPKRGTSKRGDSDGLSRLWVLSTVPTDFTEQDHKTLEKDQAAFEEKLTNNRAYEVSEIKCVATDRFARGVREGDNIVEFSKHNGRTYVLKPKRALGKTFDSKRKKLFVRVEERKRPVKRSWAGLKRILRRNRIRISKNSSRLITKEREKEILLRYFK